VSTSVYWPAPALKPQLEDESTWAPRGVKFLWPEKYDDDTGFAGRHKELHRFRYAKLRFQLGEKTWWRIYMQRPEEGDLFTFDRKTTEAMYDEKRTIIDELPPMKAPDGTDMKVPVIVALDPSLGGGNGTLAVAGYPDRMEVLHCQLNYDLTKYSQIIEQVREECSRWSGANSYISAVIVEAKSFQKGLLQDERMEEVQRYYGFRLLPNVPLQGPGGKVDSDIGVRGMPLAMRRQEITIPWADEFSRENMGTLLEQLWQWQPGKTGAFRSSNHHGSHNDIPQDLVMCLWFAWRYWRSAVKDSPTWAPVDKASEQFSSRPSPLRRRRSRIVTRRYPYGARR